MASLAEIRAKLQKQAQATGGNSTSDNGVFPHWNIQEGQTATVRFLPDADPTNTFFWLERAMIKLPFSGVTGETNSKPVVVQVPCMETWGETCPVLTEVRPWFKDKSLEEQGRKYWKKRSYLFQGFVVDSKLKEDRQPENPIRRFVISTQIFNVIKSALMDPEMEELPTDPLRGVDFRITKTTKGGYADYSTSAWARRERSLSEDETAALEKYGLFDLKEFLPKKPGEVELKVIKEMFEASVNDEAFDMERWGKYYKPSGYSNAATGGGEGNIADEDADVVVESAAKAAPRPSAPKEEEAVAGSSTSDASSRANDILAAIRNRSKT